eukprot:UN02993
MRGIDVNCVDGEGRTPLVLASYHGHRVSVNILLGHKNKSGFRIDHIDKYGKTALLNAAWMGNPAIVETLLEHNAALGIKDDDQNSCINLSAAHGHYEVLKRLHVLEKYKREAQELVNFTNYNHMTPLMSAD